MEMLLATVLLFFGLILVGLRYVPEDTAFTVRRFGRQLRVLSPGLRFTVPVFDRVTQRIRLIGHQVEVPLDGGRATHADVYYQILEPERTGAALERVDALVEQHANDALSALSANVVGDIDVLAARLKLELNRNLSELGLRVTRCDLRPDAIA